jgi:PadR family transcriptional regulator, regulatory protein PadR
MPQGNCRRHGERPCSCAMGNLYRYIEPVILLMLTRGKKHGYDLMKEVSAHTLTDSEVDPGALYRTLRRLEENGHVVSVWDVSNSGPAKRVYELTAKGHTHLEEWAEVLARLADHMKAFVKDSRKALRLSKPGVCAKLSKKAQKSRSSK